MFPKTLRRSRKLVTRECGSRGQKRAAIVKLWERHENRESNRVYDKKKTLRAEQNTQRQVPLVIPIIRVTKRGNSRIGTVIIKNRHASFTRYSQPQVTTSYYTTHSTHRPGHTIILSNTFQQPFSTCQAQYRLKALLPLLLL